MKRPRTTVVDGGDHRDAGGEPVVVVLMGVAGSGKTTIGRLLGEELGWMFYDADDFHPRSNVEKMSRGIPLTDEDRLPWLQRLRDQIRECLARNESCVVACSALRRNYREHLLVDERVKLVYLKGDHALLEQRLKDRHGHFMKPEMLASQLATLEEPEEAAHLDITPPPEVIVDAIRRRLDV